MGTELVIRDSILYAGKVPGRKKPALGLRKGTTLTVLGFFISDAECEVFETWMASMSGKFLLDGEVPDDHE